MTTNREEADKEPEDRPRTCFTGLGIFQCTSVVLMLILAVTSLIYWSIEIPSRGFVQLSLARGLTHSLVIVVSMLGIVASGLGLGMQRSKNKPSACLQLSYLSLTMIETIGFFMLLGAAIYVATEVHQLAKKSASDSVSIPLVIDVTLVIIILAHVVCAIVSMAMTCYNISRKGKPKILPVQAPPPQREVVQFPQWNATTNVSPTAPPMDATMHTSFQSLYPHL